MELTFSSQSFDGGPLSGHFVEVHITYLLSGPHLKVLYGQSEPQNNKNNTNNSNNRTNCFLMICSHSRTINNNLLSFLLVAFYLLLQFSASQFLFLTITHSQLFIHIPNPCIGQYPELTQVLTVDILFYHNQKFNLKKKSELFHLSNINNKRKSTESKSQKNK